MTVQRYRKLCPVPNAAQPKPDRMFLLALTLDDCSAKIVNESVWEFELYSI